MEAAVLDLNGNTVKQITLPLVFSEPYRPDLIKKAVLAAQANRQQPYGPHKYAGMNSSAASWRRKAIASAIAATGIEELVRARSHKFNAVLPIITVDELQSVFSTSTVIKLTRHINVYDDIVRAKRGISIRAGKGKLRGRKYKRPKSFLVIISEDKGIVKAARNLPGVDVVTVEQINAELLAPGADAGRLTIWSESAINRIQEIYK